MTTPAGWYDDGSGRQRWWDGQQWTEHLAPQRPEPAQAQVPARAPAQGEATASADPNPAPESAASEPDKSEPFVPPYALPTQASHTIPAQAAQHTTPSAPGHAAAYPPAPTSAPAPKVSALGLIGLGAAALGVVLACIPPLRIAAWVVLGLAFVLSLVSLFLRGRKWPGIAGIGVAVLGAILMGTISLVSLMVASAFEDDRTPPVAATERPTADDDASDDESADDSLPDPEDIEGAEMVPIVELEVGDCLPLIEYEEEIFELPVVPCDQPHTDEVYFIYQVEDDEFPGDAALSDAAWTRCVAEFEAFVGVAYEESELDVYYYQPTKVSWNRMDDRAVQCIVFSYEDVTGSLAGVAR